MEKRLIFDSRVEDFFKIFFATFAVFALSHLTNILSSTIFVALTVYMLDAGHVYSTLIEVLGDPHESRKAYVWLVLAGSFFLNLFVLIFLNSYFFYYIFYFTIFHNMRQGLGVTFIYRIGERPSPFVKWSYYFLTVTPFVLFHFRPSPLDVGLGEDIIKFVQLDAHISAATLSSLFYWGLKTYFAATFCIIATMLYSKNVRGLFSMLFYAGVYAYSFIYSDNQMTSYALLIFSHAIPYFFLMQKRIQLTHTLKIVKRFAIPLLVLVFLMGGLLDYYQDDFVETFEPAERFLTALLLTPLISHFIFDAILWKRGNARFQAFMRA
jgi:hypothetical protein